jgi:hypothetical protein
VSIGSNMGAAVRRRRSVVVRLQKKPLQQLRWLQAGRLHGLLQQQHLTLHGKRATV